MLTVSLCMIVKNEAKVLGRCLETIKDLVDEIIIVDTGSSDETKCIAQKYTPLIFDFPWNHHFAEARNYSFSKATKDYILWLDADDVLLENERLKLKILKETLELNIDVVTMPYHIWVDENDRAIISTVRERLIKRYKNFQWCEPVHEIINFDGNIYHADICITHKPEHEGNSRNLDIYKEYIKKGNVLSLRSIYFYAEELYNNGYYDEALAYYQSFLETEAQSNSFYINACIKLGYCYRIKNDTQNVIKAFLQSFIYDIPQPEVCMELGTCFKDLEEYHKSIFWYETGLSLVKSDHLPDSYREHNLLYIPYIYLSYCYKMIGNQESAQKYKEKALNVCKKNMIIKAEKAHI